MNPLDRFKRIMIAGGILLLIVSLWLFVSSIRQRLAERDKLIQTVGQLEQRLNEAEQQAANAKEALIRQQGVYEHNGEQAAAQIAEETRVQQEITAIRNKNDAAVNALKNKAKQEHKASDDTQLVAAVSEQRLKSLWQTYCVSRPEIDICKQQQE